MNKIMHVTAIIILLIVVFINVFKAFSDLLVTYVTRENIWPKMDRNNPISNIVIIIQLYYNSLFIYYQTLTDRKVNKNLTLGNNLTCN